MGHRIRRVGARALLSATLVAGLLTATGPMPEAHAAERAERADPAISAFAAWQIASAPSRSGSNLIYDVSCRTATRCVAVGNYTLSAPGSQFRPLALELVNGVWKTMSTPSFGKYSELYDVSCAAVSSCIAVGRWATADGFCCAPLILSLSNGTWKRMTAPAPPVTSSWRTELHGVSCATTTHCVAVGAHAGPNADKTFVVTLDNGSWTITPSQNRRAGTLANMLEDVSCVSTTSCVAVGRSAAEAVGYYTLALTLTNGQFTFAPSPRRGTLLDDNRFESVSCSSPTQCVAVGSARKLTPTPGGGPGVTVSYQGLIATWSSGTWTLHPVVEPGVPGDQYLRAVSCPSATRCVAAGKLAPRLPSGSSGDDEPHVIELSGTTWAPVPVPSPGGAFEWLNGVSCRGTARCIAAGWTQADRLRPLILAS